MSVVASFLSKATTLLASDSVPVYFGEAKIPSINPPFAVIEDVGMTPDYAMTHNDTINEYGCDGIEVTTLKISVYAVTLASVDAYVKSLKYGDGSPSQALGLDFGTLSGLGTYLEFRECKRVNEERSRESLQYTPSAQIVHKCVLTYEITTQITDA